MIATIKKKLGIFTSLDFRHWSADDNPEETLFAGTPATLNMAASSH
jgi:hypothetical protein